MSRTTLLTWAVRGLPPPPPADPMVVEARRKEDIAGELRHLNEIAERFSESAMPDVWRDFRADIDSPKVKSVVAACVVAGALEISVLREGLTAAYFKNREVLDRMVAKLAIMLAPDAAKAHRRDRARPAARAGRTRQGKRHKQQIQRWINDAAREVARTHSAKALRELSFKSSYYDLIIQELNKRHHKQNGKPVKWYREKIRRYCRNPAE